MTKSPKSALIFAGAGASKAVDHEKYPTTVEFFQKLPEEIKQNPLFQEIINFLKREEEDKIIDIELVLWELQNLKNHFAKTVNKENLVGWMTQGNRLAKIILENKNWNFGQTPQIAMEAIRSIDSLISKINGIVYDLYSEIPSEESLKQNWIPLLDNLKKGNYIIDIFTTNYDLVIEEALRFSNVSTHGWQEGTIRKLNTNLWSGKAGNREKGLLTKLHGSVNLRKRDSGIFISDPFFTGNHGNHFIIYPGFKGKPKNMIFQQFHTYLQQILSVASVAIFIGFAFRDEYINEICERFSHRGQKVIVINPSKLKELPFQTNQVRHIQTPFDAKAVDKAILAVEKDWAVDIKHADHSGTSSSSHTIS